MFDIQECKNCSLCLNQKPNLHHFEKADIMWVGLSAKKVEEGEIPLDSRTNSGSLISEIEKDLDFVFYRTNLVKCLPLEEDKLRYPTEEEMLSCLENLKKEIEYHQPKKIFLLGKQVSKFVKKNIKEGPFFEIPHPSFIYVYKRKEIPEYVRLVKELILKY